MPCWVARAGESGEREGFDLASNVAAIGWGDLGDLRRFKNRDAVVEALGQSRPGDSQSRVLNHASQIENFRSTIKVGDRILLPLKNRPRIAFGRVTGEYQFDDKASTPDKCRHQRPVKWEGEFPRDALDSDLNYSLNSALTVFSVSRNDAEARIEAIIRGARPGAHKPSASAEPALVPEPEGVDWEQQAIDEIRRAIVRKFKGYGLQDLVAGVLQARGWTTHVVPKGPDGGKDILASKGEFGLGSPSLVVQVKSQESPIGAPEVRQITHAMNATKADQGLFVAWGGFRQGVLEEFQNELFHIRLWTADDLVREILVVYDRLPEDLQVQLPLKRFWALLNE